MSVSVLTGQDTVNINDRILNDFGEGNIAELTFPNDIANVKTGKNGNSIYSLNSTGKQCELKLRVIRGSSDDQFLNGLLAQQQANFPGFPLMLGEFVKKLGDGAGNITSDTYILSGGIFSKQVEAKMNTDGDVEQSESVYMMKFSNSPRAIG